LPIYFKIHDEVKDLEKYQPDIIKHPALKGHISVMGELLLGHLRYGTQEK
jgi:amidophosphoribosyltransferase